MLLLELCEKAEFLLQIFQQTLARFDRALRGVEEPREQVIGASWARMNQLSNRRHENDLSCARCGYCRVAFLLGFSRMGVIEKTTSKKKAA